MLDFAIFAVTFLLALVGAVLYLYPVTPDLGLGVRLRREDLGGPSAGSACGSHVAPPRSAFLVRMRAVVAGLWSWAGPSFPLSLTGFGRRRSITLGDFGDTDSLESQSRLLLHQERNSFHLSLASPCKCPGTVVGMGELSSPTQTLSTCPFQRGTSQNSGVTVKETLKCIV